MANRALTTPLVGTDGELDDAPMVCAWCPPECNNVMTWFERVFDPFRVVKGQRYCSHCFGALEAACQCDKITDIQAVEYTLEKLEQAKEGGRSDYELKCLVIQWRDENERRSRAQRRVRNN